MLLNVQTDCLLSGCTKVNSDCLHSQIVPYTESTLVQNALMNLRKLIKSKYYLSKLQYNLLLLVFLRNAYFYLISERILKVRSTILNKMKNLEFFWGKKKANKKNCIIGQIGYNYSFFSWEFVIDTWYQRSMKGSTVKKKPWNFLLLKTTREKKDVLYDIPK